MKYGAHNIMEECDETMQKYFAHVYLAEAISIVSILLDEDGKKETADVVHTYLSKFLRSRPQIDRETDSAYNVFGGPQLLPQNWRYFAQGPGFPSYAGSSSGHFLKIMKEVLHGESDSK